MSPTEPAGTNFAIGPVEPVGKFQSRLNPRKEHAHVSWHGSLWRTVHLRNVRPLPPARTGTPRNPPPMPRLRLRNPRRPGRPLPMPQVRRQSLRTHRHPRQHAGTRRAHVTPITTVQGAAHYPRKALIRGRALSSTSTAAKPDRRRSRGSVRARRFSISLPHGPIRRFPPATVRTSRSP